MSTEEILDEIKSASSKEELEYLEDLTKLETLKVQESIDQHTLDLQIEHFKYLMLKEKTLNYQNLLICQQKK